MGRQVKNSFKNRKRQKMAENSKPESNEEYKETVKVSPGTFIGGLVQEFFGGYECPPYTLVNTFEVDGKKFEERKYEGGKHWVSHKKSFKKSEMKKADNGMFMSLFGYITGKNETEAKIPMTVPVSMDMVRIDENTIEKEMSFFIDKNHQENPPKPNNPALYISTRPEMTIYTRTVGGFMTEEKWEKECEELDELIEKKGLKVDKSHYYANGYDAPFKLWNRKNEVWRIKLEE